MVIVVIIQKKMYLNIHTDSVLFDMIQTQVDDMLMRITHNGKY